MQRLLPKVAVLGLDTNNLLCALFSKQKKRALIISVQFEFFITTKSKNTVVTFKKAIKSVAINRPIAHSKNAQYRDAEIAMKQSLIKEAIAYQGTTPKGNFIFTKIWEGDNYSVQFGKYGKEYYREGNKRNVNDMSPTIFRNDEKCEYDASFRAIFRLSENLKKAGDTKSLILLGCLFVRNAFLVDHKQTDAGYRYVIPQPALDYLKAHVNEHANIPIEVFLMYVDAIAWQEDVKYTTLGKPITSDVGRKNNMLTYARFIACLLGRSSYAEMLNKFSMGVSALPKNEIATTFSELKTIY